MDVKFRKKIFMGTWSTREISKIWLNHVENVPGATYVERNTCKQYQRASTYAPVRVFVPFKYVELVPEPFLCRLCTRTYVEALKHVENVPAPTYTHETTYNMY